MDKDSAIRTLWDYLRRGEPPAKADIIFVLGNEDTRCAGRAAELWCSGYAPIVVMSGATGRSTRGVFRKSEAELFAEVAMAHGVPESALILEPHATNTGENVKFTRALLAGRGVFPKTILAVQKPYAERRVLVSLRHFWPGVGLRVTSPALNFDEYCSDGLAREELPAMLAGEVHRMLEYPKRGWQAEESVPAKAVAALRVLANAGYTRHLIPGVALPRAECEAPASILAGGHPGPTVPAKTPFLHEQPSRHRDRLRQQDRG